MNIDIAALRAVEREREISFDTIIAAIESALLTAYRHTDDAHSHARVEVDRKTGQARVWATETGPEGEVLREYDDTPADFGRIATMTAKQVILQRLREATDDVTFGEFVGKEGEVVAGIVQRATTPGPSVVWCRCRSARSRPPCRRPSRCPASSTPTAPGSSAW